MMMMMLRRLVSTGRPGERLAWCVSLDEYGMGGNVTVTETRARGGTTGAQTVTVVLDPNTHTLAGPPDHSRGPHARTHGRTHHWQ